MGTAWLEQAGQFGSSEAAFRLGELYRLGSQRKVDLDKASYWYELAASQGYADAYFPVASLYFNAPPDSATGHLPPEVLAKSYLWLTVASKRSPKPDEVKQAGEMLGKVLQIMPATWKTELDPKIAKHLEKYPEK
jgi:TPR repeat protein